MAWNNVFTSDFDAETTGAAPAGYTAGNWVVAVPGLNGSVKKITGSSTLSRTFPAWNRVRFSFRMLTGASTAVRNLRVMANRNDTLPNLAGGDILFLLYWEAGGNILLQYQGLNYVNTSATLQAWLANTEYYVVMDIDCITKTFVLNINGTDYLRIVQTESQGYNFNGQTSTAVNTSNDCGSILFDSAGSSGGLDDISIDNYVPTNAVELLDPTSHRAFQRSNSNFANITVSGRYSGSPSAIEARWNGRPWTTISTSPTQGKFSGTLMNQPVGQGTFECRVVGDSYIASSSYVSVCDIIICAGQSNMSGRLTNNQSYTHPTYKALLYKNNNTWAELTDPYDVATGENDTLVDSPTGSYIPLLATQIMAATGVPCAFVPVNLGGTTSLQWQPGTKHTDRTTHYGSMIYRINKLGGARLVIWHQGESDAVAAVLAATYVSRMTTIVNALYDDTGLRLMNCKLQTCSGITDPDELEIRNAIATLWSTGVTLQGPDLVAVTTAPDPFHPTTDADGLAMATGWATAILATYGLENINETSVAVRRVPVTEVPSLIVAPNPKRQELILCNCGSSTVDIGPDSTITTGAGLPLYGEQTRERYRGFGTWLGPVYGVSTSGISEVAVWETER